jgi:small neutral amino acid transporter SnatA (MarC family)
MLRTINTAAVFATTAATAATVAVILASPYIKGDRFISLFGLSFGSVLVAGTVTVATYKD